MTALIAGDRGIDYSYARPSLTEAVQNGASFVVRYSAGVASDPSNPNHSAVAGKLISPDEFKAILAAGLDVIANDEWYATRVTEGFAAGYSDGLAAAALWKSCGLAKGASIYVSWDAFPAKASWFKVGRYVAGYRKALAGYYFVDAYAGTGFIRWAINQKFIRFGWRPSAGSWSNDGLPFQPDTSTAVKRAALVALAEKKTPSRLWQTGNQWFGNQADEDMIVRTPVGSHLESLAVKPQPAPAPTPKPAVQLPNRLESVTGGWELRLNDDGRVAIRHNGEHVAWLFQPPG